MTVAAIVVEGLTKRYGSLVAVDHVSFEVGDEEIFGFLGPNGAGKTTTIRILATLTDPTEGRAVVAGHDVRARREKVREAIGMVFQDPTLDDRLTAEENLLFHGMLYGMSAGEVRRRATPLLELVGLAERRRSLVRTFSGGMKRRLELVRGLIHRPRVLFLDEPTVGLDPQTRAQIWQHVTQLSREEGVAVFMTTHYMEEAEYCRRIAIMDHGRLVTLDTPERLKAGLGHEVLALTLADERTADDVAASVPEGRVERDGTRLRVVADDAAELLAEVSRRVGGRLQAAEIRRPTLDDVFLALTGREIREADATARDAMRQARRMYR
jgi:ABC-2 type transport system ATP-binding protein